MSLKKDGTSRTGLDQGQRDVVKKRLEAYLDETATALGVPKGAVARQSLYGLQRHSDPAVRVNASPAEQRAAFKFWGGCQRPGCSESLTFSEAVFHHVRRDVPNPHAPENLQPFHDGCHDREHAVSTGSLSKGSPRRRK